MCRNKTKSCSRCGMRHHESICNSIDKPMRNDTQSKVSDAFVAAVTPFDVNEEPNRAKTVLLQTASVLVEGRSATGYVRCLLDGGSQRTFIREDNYRSLNLKIVGEEFLKVHTFGSDGPISKRFRKVRVILKSSIDQSKDVEIEALETPHISGAIVSVPGEEIRTAMNTKGLHLAEPNNFNYGEDSRISILVGADYYWKIVTGRVERLGEKIVAVETILGWCVQGPTPVFSLYSGVESETQSMKVMVEDQTNVSNQLRAFWELDSLGILDDHSQMYSEKEKETMQQFQEKIQFKEQRYEVALPWKTGKEQLSNNRYIAMQRFLGVLKRFQRDVSFYEHYRKAISEYLEAGIAEPVPIPDLQKSTNVYYLPHHAVLREDKATTKMRVVFDASSKEPKSSSLNDCLMSGPNLNPDLYKVLLRFRTHKVAFTSDIEGAFHQVTLAEEERDVVRFLWIDGPHSLTELNDPRIKEFRMTRVIFGATCSPFLLGATIKHHVKKYSQTSPEACNVLEADLYVDDLISGAEEVEEDFKISTDAKKILGEASMNLRKWTTNSRELLDYWQGTKDIQVNDSKEQSTGLLRVLGITWNPATDAFYFYLNTLIDFISKGNGTKRFVLQTAARIFDPIGFLSPFMIKVKIIFQELWQRGIAWEESLPEDLLREWEQWCDGIHELKRVEIPRFYFKEAKEQTPMNKQLHYFCDASQKAYAVVVYLRYEMSDGEIGVRLATSKTRIAPIKKLTLPRLELMACVIGARLYHQLKTVFDWNDVDCFLWTDSTIALHWIHGSPTRWKPFVANRVIEIHSKTDPIQWHHCPGTENPADYPSRGQDAEQFVQNDTWWNGPDWLKRKREERPSKETIGHSEAQEQEDEKVCVQLICLKENLEPIFKMDKFSSKRRLLRITAWILRFCYNSRKPEDHKNGSLTTDELDAVEKYWIGFVQRETFPLEINCLLSGSLLPKDSKISELCPFLDADGLLRVGSRLQNSKLEFKETHPLILPTRHKFCELQITQSHQEVMHSGQRDTLSQLRGKFWMLRGRQMVKTIVKSCLICKRFRVKAGAQITAPLPFDRVRETPPFHTTGVDFAGPLCSKSKTTHDKAYIALFTCAVTRAIHLELVSNLTSENFLLAFRRFIARRGLCGTIYSDNAQTFKRTNQDLKDIWKNLKSKELQDYFGFKGINWKFIVERGAWWGGFWERLVRSVKTVLKKVLGKNSLNFEELGTLLTEIEAVINSRPITFVYSEGNEPSPLTPAHFLVGQRLTALPPQFSTTGSNQQSAGRKELAKRWRHRQALVQHFWKRWQKEYLLELKSAHSSPSTKEGTELTLGYVVLVQQDNLPRHMWKMARVTELYKGRDSKVRSCKVKLPSGLVLKRPIPQLLYPLELR